MKDEVVQEGRWEFNQEVTDAFDDMLARSIPGYNLMRELTTELACDFADAGEYVVDLGCSRGAALKAVAERRRAKNKYLGVEVSEPMRRAAEQELSGWMGAGLARVDNIDLRDDYPKVGAAVTLSVLTLMFTPIEYRQRILADAYEQTMPGGVLLLVEKVLGANHKADSVLRHRYYKMKGENGYTPEQVNTKRRSLEGVLVPVTEQMNRTMLEAAGFKGVDCFWRSLNFAGWFAIK